MQEEVNELPVDMAEAIAALHSPGDEELWRAARQSLAPEKAADLEELHMTRQSEGLSASYIAALATLMKEERHARAGGPLDALQRPASNAPWMTIGAVKGRVDFGILTVREDEFRAVLRRFRSTHV
ncbi:hypothetical protein WME76_35275 [Sorangium sp. So ce119]|uniref:hypothetical protein n=1 Tax=Sorangium sp. So ce119 TaxID=3133279 RepID=UPI003F5DC067